jgi:glycosyl hydrolase family 53
LSLKFSRWLLVVSTLSAAGAPRSDEFIAGADVSHLVFFEDRGIVYRDDGQPQDALAILKRRGFNCARLRLFTSSAQQARANPYDSRNCLTNATARYGKPVIVAETAFPWDTHGAPIVGIDPGVKGQVEFVVALANVVKSVRDEMGIGIFWWGTEYQHLAGMGLAGFDTRSFFDLGGNILPAADALGQLTVPVRLSASLTDNVLTLNWPFSGAALSLVTAASLAPPVAWLPVTNAIHITGGVFGITLPASAKHDRYYRLQSN